jgi:hypothetical protein
MKTTVNHFSVRPLVLLFLTAALTLVDCEMPGDRNTAAVVNARSGSGQYCYYTPRGSRIPICSTVNCHGFAWQNGSCPTTLPSYGISDPAVFIRDGSYTEVTGEVLPGDRVNWGDWHSAVVSGKDEYGRIYINQYWAGSSAIEWGVPVTKVGGSPRYFRIADTKYWNTPNLPRRKIALYAPMMGAYVCADFWDNTEGTDHRTWNSDAPLWANRSWIQDWETFYLIDAGGGKVNLWSYATFAYVIAFPNSRAIANGGYPGTAGTFTLEDWSGYSFFKSNISINNWNYYLRPDSFIPQNMYMGWGACFEIIDLN